MVERVENSQHINLGKVKIAIISETRQMTIPFQQALFLESEGFSAARSAALLGLTAEDQLSLLEDARVDLQGRVFNASIPRASPAMIAPKVSGAGFPLWRMRKGIIWIRTE